MMSMIIISELPLRRPGSKRKCKTEIIEDDYGKNRTNLSKFSSYLDKEYIYIGQSFEWMKHNGSEGEIEGFMVGSQDQALNTRYY